MQREVISSASVPSSGLPFSPALKVGNWVYVSGQAAYDADGNAPATIEEQTEVTFGNVKALLEAGDPFEFAPVGQAAGRVDGLTLLERSPAADRIEILECESQRIHDAVAAIAGRVRAV